MVEEAAKAAVCRLGCTRIKEQLEVVINVAHERTRRFCCSTWDST